MSELSIPWTTIAAIAGGIIGLITTGLGILASRRKEAAGATLDLSGAWQATVSELRIEIARLQARVDVLEAKDQTNREVINKLTRDLTQAERDLEKSNYRLQLAEESVNIALSWINEHQPALKAAGIEPLDESDLKFRGDEVEE